MKNATPKTIKSLNELNALPKSWSVIIPLCGSRLCVNNKIEMKIRGMMK